MVCKDLLRYLKWTSLNNYIVMLNVSDLYSLGYLFSEFCNMVRKIFIYTNEEVKKLSPKVKLPASDEVKPCKSALDNAVGTEDQLSDVGPAH